MKFCVIVAAALVTVMEMTEVPLFVGMPTDALRGPGPHAPIRSDREVVSAVDAELGGDGCEMAVDGGATLSLTTRSNSSRLRNPSNPGGTRWRDDRDDSVPAVSDSAGPG